MFVFIQFEFILNFETYDTVYI